jgi:hypothetical protein
MSFKHLFSCTDDFGLFSKTIFTIPLKKHGYLTYENALGFIATLKKSKLSPLAKEKNNIYLGFIIDSIDRENGYASYKCSHQKKWINNNDIHHLGFLVWAFGFGYNYSEKSLKPLCKDYFKSVMTFIPNKVPHSVLPYLLMGIYHYLNAERIDVKLIEKAKIWSDDLSNHHIDNPLFKIISSYALLLMAEKLISLDSSKKGLGFLEEYISSHLEPTGIFTFEYEGSDKQYPFEAYFLTITCLKAFDLTKSIKWKNYATLSYNWFLGKNDLKEPVIDSSTFGCLDWISSKSKSSNQSALATLSWVMTLEEMKFIKNEIRIKTDYQLEIAAIQV